MFAADKLLKQKTDKRKSENSFRFLSVNDKLIDFCSNDYLGFSSTSILKDKIESSNYSFGKRYYGSTGSRSLTGNSLFAEELENKISAFHQAEAGLIFNSGYNANIGLFSSVPQRGDTIIYDELIHASIHDGMRLNLAEKFAFSHNNIQHLEKFLQTKKGNCFVAVESVYSMDGDFAPLKEIAALCNKYEAHLIVDEAHATGLFGTNGEGRIIELGLQQNVFARVHTYGKALGCHGAIVIGSKALKEYLINFARSFIFTTALPLYSLIAIDAAYELLKNIQPAIRHIRFLIKNFKESIGEINNLKLIHSESAIQCILLSGNDSVRNFAKKIQQDGLDVRPIIHPSVPKGKERIRICLHAFNTPEELALLVHSIKNSL